MFTSIVSQVLRNLSSSYNRNHCSNESELFKLTKKILFPYIHKLHRKDDLPFNQIVLITLDALSGQIITTACFKGDNIVVACMPANMKFVLQDT